MMPDETHDTRCGFVALIGAPNVGKSTLVNALVGSKVTIVSKKVQTTRALIRGIVIEDNAQIILVDTPGIFAPKRRLDRAMVSTAWSGAHDADLVCVLLDARAGIDDEADAIFNKLASVNHPKILVINKIDLVPREKLLALALKANERLAFDQTFMISAMSGDGVDDLRHALAKDVPAGPFHYPEDQMSDAPLRHLAAEITREKIYRHLHRELPYQSTFETDSWTERKDKSVRIEQTIFVERDSQRKIVLGKGGATIKSIGADSRKEIAEIVGVPVHLFLFVNGAGVSQRMTGPDVKVPNNIFYFEVLLYMSLFIDAASMPFRSEAFNDVTDMTAGAKLITAVMILLFVYLVWLAAHRRQNWARMVLLVALGLSVLSIAEMLRVTGLQPETGADIVSAILTGLGMYLSFTGDARGWFQRQ
jgi:GTPase